MRGHHLGVEDLTRGDEGVPVRATRFENTLSGYISAGINMLIYIGYQTSPMGASDNRLGALPSLGGRCSRNWFLDGFVRPLLP